MLIWIDPVPKPRMTMRDRWAKRKCVVRYFRFCDDLRASGASLGVGDSIFFGIPMPGSWSKKKRKAMVGCPHDQKPDIDNLLKAVMDALVKDDCKIWQIGCIEKRWSETGFIMINKPEQKGDL